MRQRQGIPAEADAASAWLGMAESARQWLTPAARVEFASYLIDSVLTMAGEGDALREEPDEAVQAVSYAHEVLADAGW